MLISPPLRALLPALLLAGLAARAQTVPLRSATPAAPAPTPPPGYIQPTPDSTSRQPWSLHFQQTLVLQWHPSFRAPYEGEYSLSQREKAKTSLTSTFFLGRRLWRGASAFFNPKWPAAAA